MIEDSIRWTTRGIGRLSDIHKVIITRIDRFLKDRCQSRKNRKLLKTGSVSFVQRFGSLLNLHPHFHILFTDGCFDFGEGGQRLFERVDLVEAMVEELLSSIVEGIELKLSKLSELWVKQDGEGVASGG